MTIGVLNITLGPSLARRKIRVQSDYAVHLIIASALAVVKEPMKKPWLLNC